MIFFNEIIALGKFICSGFHCLGSSERLANVEMLSSSVVNIF